MISLKECENLGLIKRMAPSQQEAEEQLEKARTLLMEAKGNIASESVNTAVMAGYASMFDAARALLFKDGYREKSHTCVARYLETRYKKEISSDYIDLLDQYRVKRHKVMYASDYYPTSEEAKELVKFAERFVELVEKIVIK